MQSQGTKQWSSRPLSQDEHDGRQDSRRGHDVNDGNNDYCNPDEQQRPAGLAPSRRMLSDPAGLPQSSRGVETIAWTHNGERVQSGENILRQSFFTHMHDQLSGEKMCPD